jgi:hypothetical protein
MFTDGGPDSDSEYHTSRTSLGNELREMNFKEYNGGKI